MLPGGHAAALQAFHAARPAAVLRQHLQRVLADLGLVVLHEAGLEQHGLGAGPGLDVAALLGPGFEGGGGEVRQVGRPVDAQRPLHEPAVDRHPVHGVGQAEGGPGQLRGKVRIAQDPVAQGAALPLPALGLVAVDEPGEVQGEGVALAGRVGALHLAELALEAVVHDPVALILREGAHIALVLVVDEAEEAREGVAVLEAHAAAVADLEGPLHFLLEQALVPVAGVRRIVDGARPGLIADPLPRRGVRTRGAPHLVAFGHGAPPRLS